MGPLIKTDINFRLILYLFLATTLDPMDNIKLGADSQTSPLTPEDSNSTNIPDIHFSDDQMDTDAFKDTFNDLGFVDFQKLFELTIKLFGSCCPQTLAACLKIIVELLHRSYVRHEEMLATVGGEIFMSKLHFVMTW